MNISKSYNKWVETNIKNKILTLKIKWEDIYKFF